MRNLLAVFALALIGFAAIGWYRGWYAIETAPTANGGRNINIDVNSAKIKTDLSTGKQKLRNILASDKNDGTTPESYYPEGVPAVFRSPNGGGVPLPRLDPDAIDISDHDGWWPVKRK